MIQEQISSEAYTWYAAYGDDHPGLHEHDATNFADVDQSQTKALLLLPLNGTFPHCVDIPQGAQPVFFRRRSIEINLMQGEGAPRPTVHCIGWRKGDAAVYLFVFDDGSTLLTDNLQAV